MLIWFILSFMGLVVFTIVTVVVSIVAVTKAGTGESWLDCTKRLFKGFVGK